MIQIQVTRRDGRLYRITSRGHGIVSSGMESPSCAVVSILLKSFGLSIVEKPGCHVTGGAPKPGTFDMTCEECTDEAWYRGAVELLERSLQELETTWPEDVQVQYIEERSNGT